MLRDYSEAVTELVRRTGLVLLDHWRRPQDLRIHKKADGSPATTADLAAHQVLVAGLTALDPSIPILSEEGEWPEYAERAQWQRYWLVDPLDGTRGFINHLPQFSINIALVERGEPILGIIGAPAMETIYYAWQGQAFKQVGMAAPQRMHLLPKAADAPWRVLVGYFSQGKRLKQLIGEQCAFELLRINSAVKFGLLAEGQADIYPRLGSISEWDTAAGQCILTAIGGAVVDLKGQTLQYNRKASLLNPDFIAVPDTAWIEPWLKILTGD